MSDDSVTTFDELIKAGHLEIGDGYRTKQSEHGRPGLPILRVAEVLDGKVEPRFETFVSEFYRSAMGAKVSRVGDIVLTTKGTVGRVAMIPAGSPEFVYSPQVCFFRTRPMSPLISRYLYYWFKSKSFWSQAESLKSQTDMADYINLADIRSLRIYLPPQQVQQAVVAVLGALDDKIAVNDRIVNTSRILARSRFSNAARQANRTVKLRDIIDLRYGKALPARDRENGRIPVFGGNGISGCHRAPLVKGPGIIVGRKGANAGSISWSQGPFWVIDTAFYIEATPHGFPLQYAFFLLETVGFRNIVGDSAIPGLNREIALACNALLPSRDVVSRFAADVRPLLELQAQIFAESASLVEVRDMLLPRLMSGAIRVRDAGKIVEGVT